MFCCFNRCHMSPAAVIVTITTVIKLYISAGVNKLQRAFTHIIFSLSHTLDHVISLSIILQWLLLLDGWYPGSLLWYSRHSWLWPLTLFLVSFMASPYHLPLHAPVTSKRLCSVCVILFPILHVLAFASPSTYMSFLIFSSSFLPTSGTIRPLLL